MTKIFYGPSNVIKPLLETLAGTTGNLGELSNYILEPTPYFNIRTNYNYAGDNIIGYNYTLDFEGTVVPTGTENPRSLEANMEYLSKNREILNYYGGTLYLTDDEFNTLFKAKGGRLENINYNNSQNNWAASIPYTASLEFQDIVMGTGSLVCDTPIIDPSSIIVNLADLTKYKIKSDLKSFNKIRFLNNQLLPDFSKEGLPDQNEIIFLTQKYLNLYKKILIGILTKKLILYWIC